MRMLVRDRVKVVPLGRLTRSEWKALPATSPAKAGRTRHATTIITVTYLVVAAAGAAFTFAIGGGLGLSAVAAVLTFPAGGAAALRVDTHLRWRFYRSLWDDPA